jgi:LPXTG-motif cell wall-anchored protein
LLGSSVVGGGSATVSLPRTLGSATVLAVALRQQDPGIALPYVPIAQLVQLPLSASSEMQVNPRVGAPGTTITVSGACAGTPRVIIAGRPGGWYDVPPVYADVVALPSNGPFSLTAPMPVLPSTVRLLCTSGGVTEIVQQLISPATGDLVQVFAIAAGGGYLVSIPAVVSPQLLAAFGLTGDAVPLSVVATSAVVTVRLEPPVGVSDVVIVGLETLGENAEARQNVRVQGWTVHLSGAVAATSTTSTAPTTSTTSTAPTTSTTAPTDPSVTGEPGGPTSSQPTPSVPGAASAVLPSTGVSSNQTSVAAIVCILVGLLAVALARGRVTRRPGRPANR